MLYDDVKNERIKDLDLHFILSDIVYVNYNIITSGKYEINFDINSLSESIMYNLIFL